MNTNTQRNLTTAGRVAFCLIMGLMGVFFWAIRGSAGFGGY